MHIGVIGTGYVGLVTGACFAEFGIFVTCVDKDAQKIRALKKGEIPFYEPGLDELVKRNVDQGRLNFSTRVADAVKESLVIFIAVGTPPRGDGSADLQYVDQVARQIASFMNDYKVIVTKSTVPVGTGERIRNIISKSLKKEVKFDVVSNPEFLREGAAIEDFMRPNRVVIGTDSEQAVAIMKDLYKPLYLIEAPFVITNIETSELIKYASNSFLATKISFINEIANLCEKVGADVHMVAKGMGLDGRIGRKFLHAGPGFGGSCFPKDIKALLQLASEYDVDLAVVRSVVVANDRQRELMVEKISNALGGVRGKKIGVLGLSFKPNTNDMRDAPSIFIINALTGEGAAIKAYDPVAMDDAKAILPSIQYCRSSYEALKGVDAAVLITEWNQFRNLDMQRVKDNMKMPVFFDLRNVYEPVNMKELGFQYYCVGRS